MTQEKISTEMSPFEKVNFLYDKYVNKFPNSFFHTLLWNLFINKTRKMSDAAFTPVIKSGYTLLGIADKGMKGYTPTMTVFETHNYDEAQKICVELNKDVFGLTEEQADEIVFSTLKN